MTAYCSFDIVEFTDPARIEKHRLAAARGHAVFIEGLP